MYLTKLKIREDFRTLIKDTEIESVEEVYSMETMEWISQKNL